jgi:hypothetical protein
MEGEDVQRGSEVQRRQLTGEHRLRVMVVGGQRLRSGNLLSHLLDGKDVSLHPVNPVVKNHQSHYRHHQRVHPEFEPSIEVVLHPVAHYLFLKVV